MRRKKKGRPPRTYTAAPSFERAQVLGAYLDELEYDPATLKRVWWDRAQRNIRRVLAFNEQKLASHVRDLARLTRRKKHGDEQMMKVVLLAG